MTLRVAIRRRWPGPVVGLAVLCLAGGAPTRAPATSAAATPAADRGAASAAGCGGVERAAPAGHLAFRPPLAIGDSTMLFALPGLAHEGFAVNAHGCRQFPEALALLDRLRRGRALPHLVAIALGADGAVTAADIGRALAILGPGHLLVMVTPRELGGGSGADAAAVRGAGRAHPGRVVVLDWVGYAAGHGDWFQPDGLHLTLSGAAAFAHFLAQVLPLARPAPPAPACPTRATPGATGGLDAAMPRVSLVRIGSSPPDVLATSASEPGSVLVGLVNANPFPLAGRLTLAPLEPAVDPRRPTSTVCVTVPAGAELRVRIRLGAALRRLLVLRQRYPVRLVVRLHDAAGASASVSAVYVLARPASR